MSLPLTESSTPGNVLAEKSLGSRIFSSAPPDRIAPRSYSNSFKLRKKRSRISSLLSISKWQSEESRMATCSVRKVKLCPFVCPYAEGAICAPCSASKPSGPKINLLIFSKVISTEFILIFYTKKHKKSINQKKHNIKHLI